MFYDRKVKYLNYYEAGEALKGSGFVKLEVRDKMLRWEISVKGLRDISGTFPVLLVGEKESAVAEITLAQGSGNFRQECHVEDDIAATGIAYSSWRGVRIPLADGREVACYWEPYAVPARAVNRTHAAEYRSEPAGETESDVSVTRREMRAAEEGTEPDAFATRRVAQDAWEGTDPSAFVARGQVRDAEEGTEPSAFVARGQVQDAEEGAEPGAPAARRVVQNAWEGTGSDAPAARRVVRDAERRVEPVRQAVRRSVVPRAEVQERVVSGGENMRRGRREQIAVRSQTPSERNASETWREDKWSQLCAIYPHINPFHDEREYLSISPADFVLFPERDYRAVHNSFLLHGYYNYKHLILTRVEHRGELLYYVGVPGNYCEKEKQVAVMFRFESFECASEPAEYGDFGYYMMRVNL